ncbi:hypothetical protein ONS95_012360 [Cadophora gregata]|uniref:uncharacterized protein n=1 Tax=Cadophora gregata TaxID=51156 RepID=UPI0026DA7C46|nr:uncharacterized protein ONS95_012360 [Cadophora gregata]KAK0118050.1 hypothetical protein ONS95_012360 [Cadophora gregata]KAK0123120.1 hypothetical protein ONS96_010125 [Cadophora gregata f. sp. sojae]
MALGDRFTTAVGSEAATSDTVDGHTRMRLLYFLRYFGKDYVAGCLGIACDGDMCKTAFRICKLLSR